MSGVKGGQGRTPESLERDGMVLVAIVAMVFFAAAVALICGAVAAVVS